jgi:hypothetical protein
MACECKAYGHIYHGYVMSVRKERQTLDVCCVQVHPHVIGLREVFLTNDYLAIVLDHATGGDLLTYVNGK